MLVAFILMHLTGIPANLLSLGAIDFGILVDSAVVFVETILVRREADPNKPLSESDVGEVLTQVARPIFFARLITITAYLPLFAFQRVEKKLFAPMAYTVTYALAGALLIALALIPSLAFLIYRRPHRAYRNSVLTWLRQRYENELTRVTARPRRALVPGAAAVALAVILALILGREFLPYLDEGSIWLQIGFAPGISLAKASEMAGDVRRTLHEFPEVSYVVTQLGRNDDGTDSWTFSHIESSVGLKPYSTGAVTNRL